MIRFFRLSYIVLAGFYLAPYIGKLRGSSARLPFLDESHVLGLNSTATYGLLGHDNPALGVCYPKQAGSLWVPQVKAKGWKVYQFLENRTCPLGAIQSQTGEQLIFLTTKKNISWLYNQTHGQEIDFSTPPNQAGWQRQVGQESGYLYGLWGTHLWTYQVWLNNTHPRQIRCYGYTQNPLFQAYHLYPTNAQNVFWELLVVDEQLHIQHRVGNHSAEVYRLPSTYHLVASDYLPSLGLIALVASSNRSENAEGRAHILYFNTTGVHSVATYTQLSQSNQLIDMLYRPTLGLVLLGKTYQKTVVWHFKNIESLPQRYELNLYPKHPIQLSVGQKGKGIFLLAGSRNKAYHQLQLNYLKKVETGKACTRLLRSNLVEGWSVKQVDQIRGIQFIQGNNTFFGGFFATDCPAYSVVDKRLPEAYYAVETTRAMGACWGQKNRQTLQKDILFKSVGGGLVVWTGIVCSLLLLPAIVWGIYKLIRIYYASYKTKKKSTNSSRKRLRHLRAARKPSGERTLYPL